MSKPKYIWWPYVKAMIRRYPELKEQYQDLHEPALTISYSDHVGGGEPARSTEAIATKQLPPVEQREYDAVRRAVEVTMPMRTGAVRLSIVRMVLWDQTHSLRGAAAAVGYSYDAAQGFLWEFIRLVAFFYGLLDCY